MLKLTGRNDKTYYSACHGEYLPIVKSDQTGTWSDKHQFGSENVQCGNVQSVLKTLIYNLN